MVIWAYFRSSGMGNRREPARLGFRKSSEGAYGVLPFFSVGVIAKHTRGCFSRRRFSINALKLYRARS